MVCDNCGHELVVGDFPFCPHGRSALAIEPDDVPGGFTVENGFDEPRTFYSKSAHQRALAEQNMEQRAFWHPGDQHLTRWDTVNLDGARELVSRNSDAAHARNVARELTPITVTALDESFKESDLG